MKWLKRLRLLAAIASMTLAGSADIEAVAIESAVVPELKENESRELVQSLAGDWSLQVDPGDQGIADAWFRQPSNVQTKHTIQLPGSLQSQGFGENVSVATPWTGQIVDRSWYDSPEYAQYREPGNLKIPFSLQPENHYIGAA